MGEIKDFINVYIEDSGMIEDKFSEIELNLTANIQDQLYPGHGFIRGDLHDSINSDIKSSNKNGGIIEAYTAIYYAPWVNDGSPAVEGKLMKMPWGYRTKRKAFKGYKFMEKGLDATVAMYR